MHSPLSILAILVAVCWHRPATRVRRQDAADLRLRERLIKGLDPKLFNFTREELKEVDFVEHVVPRSCIRRAR